MKKPHFRASEIDRRKLCPGSKLLEQNIKTEYQQKITSLGRQIHYAIAKWYVENQGATHSEYLTPEDPVDERMQWAVNQCINDSLDLIPDNYAIVVEDELYTEHEAFTLSGHIDLICINESATIAKGWDWKTGYKTQLKADESMQVAAYIDLLWSAYPSLEYAEFRIHQPVAHMDEDEERTTTYICNGVEELQRNRDILHSTIQYILDNQNTIEMGEKQCEYCRARHGICPQIKKAMKEILDQKQIDEAKDLSPQELADLTVNCRILGKICEETVAMAKQRVIDGEQMSTSDGKQLTVRDRKGKYVPKSKPEFFHALESIIGHQGCAEIANFGTTDIRNTIAEKKDVPKTSKKKESAASIFEDVLKPLCEQEVQKILVIE